MTQFIIVIALALLLMIAGGILKNKGQRNTAKFYNLLSVALLLAVFVKGIAYLVWYIGITF